MTSLHTTALPPDCWLSFFSLPQATKQSSLQYVDGFFTDLNQVTEANSGLPSKQT